MSVQEHTYMPTDVDETLVDALESGATVPDSRPRLYLTVDDSDGIYELPDQLSSLLRQVVEAMHEGLAITVKPQSQQLTTSQVADLLGVTRPTVVKLLESGAIPYTRVGTHRRVGLSDALRYRDARREQQYDFITTTQTNDEPPREKVLADLKRIRAEHGAARRQAPYA